MRYVIALLADEQAMAQVPQAALAKVFEAFEEYSKAMPNAGLRLGGEALHPSSKGGKRIQVRDGKRIVKDGPFTETKETLGGYYLIETKTPEEALEWAARCPGAQRAT